MGSNNAILHLENIRKSFGGLLVLTDIDLSVEQGQIVGLICPNGAGKSTLFNIITTLYKPDAGDIFLNQHKITGYPTHKICRLGISRTFQLVISVWF